MQCFREHGWKLPCFCPLHFCRTIAQACRSVALSCIQSAIHLLVDQCTVQYIDLEKYRKKLCKLLGSEAYCAKLVRKCVIFPHLQVIVSVVFRHNFGRTRNTVPYLYTFCRDISRRLFERRHISQYVNSTGKYRVLKI